MITNTLLSSSLIAQSPFCPTRVSISASVVTSPRYSVTARSGSCEVSNLPPVRSALLDKSTVRLSNCVLSVLLRRPSETPPTATGRVTSSPVLEISRLLSASYVRSVPTFTCAPASIFWSFSWSSLVKALVSTLLS